MNSLIKTSLLGLAFISTVSMAQTSAFSGAAVGASVNLSGASFKYTEADNDYGTNGDQNIGLALSASYGLDVSSEILVLLGVDLDFIEKKFWRTDDSKNYANTKNSMSLFAAPGMLINENTLVYGKLSLETTKVNIGTQTTSNNVTTTRSKEESVNGVGFGLGVLNKINKNLFLQTEIKRVNYNSLNYFNDKVEASTTSGNVGLLYKF
jgi:opacity protein-like surface antigen